MAEPEEGPAASSPAPGELLELAVRTAHAAGALLLAARADGSRRASLAAGARRKSSVTDLVTEADQASEQLVRSALGAARPDDGLLGEEGGASVGSSGITWVIDPLDGTTNFVYDYPGWAVSIAAVGEGGAVAGAVYDPRRDETFAAALGEGATLNGEPLRDGGAAELGEALVGTGFGYSAQRRARQASLLPRLLPAVRDIRRGGSAALDLCYVAAGRLDAYYESGLQPWDRAAGLLVAAEAGADFEDLELGGPGGSPLPATLVVARPGLFEELRALLRASAGGD